ncbi:hypothetical protein KI387_022556, partial [Taxus chinensis]
MGTGEEGTPTKTPAKPSSTNQETPTTPAYPDWAAAFQAYYGPGATPPPPAFFASTVGSAPTPHPYMWGGQPLMPPYGTPLPYPAMYPHGVYAHPSMPPGALPYGHYGMPSPGNAEVTTAAAPPNAEAEAKASEGKDKNTMKRSKGSLGSLGMITGKGGDGGKATSGSANEAGSQSGESGSDGSSEGSEEENAQNELQVARKRSFDQMIVDGANAQNNHISTYNAQAGESYMNSSGHALGNPISQTVAVPLGPVTGKPAASGPITNLNIGMDYWNASAAGAITTVKARGSISTALVPATAQLMPPGREGVPPELWIQDERELKRQRRKQSNRESARRSRLRKQAECEELAQKVETLTVENISLRSELNRMAEECKKLTAENASIMEQLSKVHGEDTATASEENGPTKIGLQSVKAEGNGHFHDIPRGLNSNS